jgi:hypothetical protein
MWACGHVPRLFLFQEQFSVNILHKHLSSFQERSGSGIGTGTWLVCSIASFLPVIHSCTSFVLFKVSLLKVFYDAQYYHILPFEKNSYVIKKNQS